MKVTESNFFEILFHIFFSDRFTETSNMINFRMSARLLKEC